MKCSIIQIPDCLFVFTMYFKLHGQNNWYTTLFLDQFIWFLTCCFCLRFWLACSWPGCFLVSGNCDAHRVPSLYLCAFLMPGVGADIILCIDATPRAPHVWRHYFDSDMQMLRVTISVLLGKLAPTIEQNFCPDAGAPPLVSACVTLVVTPYSTRVFILPSVCYLSREAVGPRPNGARIWTPCVSP